MTTLTKEAILDKYIFRTSDDYDYRGTLSAMEEFSKQEAIEFAKWSGALFIRYNSIETGNEPYWVSRIETPSKKYTDTELYELWKQGDKK